MNDNESCFLKVLAQSMEDLEMMEAPDFHKVCVLLLLCALIFLDWSIYEFSRSCKLY